MSLASIAAIMAALFVLGIVLVAVFNMNHIVNNLGSMVEVTFFLKKETSYDDIMVIKEQIKTWPGVREVEYISKSQALEKMKQELGSRLDGYTEENNPFPDSFNITVEKPDDVKNIIPRIQAIPFTEKINYSQVVIDIINKITRTIHIIGLSLVALLALISAIIINNTIKLTVHSRRKEIAIMKIVGATDGYIRWPFIIEGFLLGIIGALLSLGLISGIYHYLLTRTSLGSPEGAFLSIFQLIPLNDFVTDVMIIFLLVGGVVGFFASAISIKKYLKV